MDHVLIWLAFYGFTLICLRISYASKPKVWGILGSIVFVQLLLKLFDRYYLPNFQLRAGDENFWLASLATYQTNSTIPVTTLAQGPGIFYASALVGALLHIGYPLALVVLAVALGCLYVLPAYRMYSSFSEGNYMMALSAVALVSMSDVMIYSTTIARPTLFGLFLIPFVMHDVHVLYEHPGPLVFLRLFTVTFMILLIHTPISYVVVLLTLVFLLALRKATKWVGAYVILAFGSYGVFLRLALPDLYRIWRVELFGAYPLSSLSSLLGNNFFLLFFLAGFAVVSLSWFAAYIREMTKGYKIRITARTAYVILGVALALSCGLVILKYSSYIDLLYGGASNFLLLQGWKIPFAFLVIYGLRKGLQKRSKDIGFLVPLSWLISIGVAVVFLATYPPLSRFVGLWNLDERFAEFAYYPAFYFIAIGIANLRGRFSGRVFDWLILPALTLFVIPSIILGTRDLLFF